MNGIFVVDEIIREYLTFRGFQATFKVFDQERKNDKLKAFQVDRIIDQLFFYLTSFDGYSMMEYWSYLNHAYFGRLESSFMKTVNYLELCLKRYYLINAYQAGRNDKVLEFFNVFLVSYHRHPDWAPWFSFPHLKKPENEPQFEPFFTKQWLENFMISLRNFIVTVFSNMKPPQLLNFAVERQRRKALEAEILSLKAEIARLSVNSHNVIINVNNNTSVNTSNNLGNNTNINNINNTNNNSSNTSSNPSIINNILTNNNYFASGNNDQFDNNNNSNNSNKPEASITQPITSSPTTPLPSTDANIDNNNNNFINNGNDSSSSANTTLDVSPIRIYSAHQGPVSCARFSHTGEYVASCSIDGSARIWAVSSPSNSPNLLITSSSSSSTATTPTSALTTSKDKDATILSSAEVLSLEWHGQSDRYLLIGGNNRRVKVWDVENKKVVMDVGTNQNFPRVIDIASQTGLSSYVATAAPQITFGDQTNPISQTNAGNNSGPPPPPPANSEGYMICVNLKTMAVSHEFTNLGYMVNRIKFNHNGQLLVGACADGYVRIFDMTTHKSIHEWKAHNGQAAAIRFNSDFTKVISAGTDGKVVVRDLNNPNHELYSWNFTNLPNSALQNVQGIDMSLDASDSTLLLAFNETKAKLFDLTNGDLLRQLDGHTGPVVTCDWHPSEPIIVTGSYDHTVRASTVTHRHPATSFY